MATTTFLILSAAIIVAAFAFPHPEVEIITQPKPGQEYVFVQSSGSGARPIARKDKQEAEERSFETAHKFPPSLTYALLNHDEDEEHHKDEGKAKKPIIKREARDKPAPAPAGAIKLDVQKLLEKYKTELKSSTTEKPSSTSRTTRKRGGSRRSKKETKKEDGFEVTSPRTVLTTGKPSPKKIDDDDIPLTAAGSEKQRSRIQVKKGPNGQEYEYEYVYYYYDDDDEPKDAKKDAKKESPKTTNAHDGPARNQITQAPTRNNKGRQSVEKTSVAPEVNEVVPSRGRTRGRQLGEEESVGEERLPANTRFPPRSRNLNTTPLPEEETKPTTRGRGRGRPTTEAAPSTNSATEADSVSDETQGSRGRTRANVRRPSLDLVDNASFNTHSNTAGAEASSPSFPSDLPAGPEATASKEETLKPSSSSSGKSNNNEEGSTDPSEGGETTTVMSAMDKVALDLYAILQGTQKLSGEEGSEEDSTGSTSETEMTTIELTTETEITTPTTTTTTTTTTTPAPTTTVTTEAPAGRNRFKGRGRKPLHSASTTTTEAAPAPETKPKSKFGRPRPRPGARTTSTTEAAAVEKEAAKQDSKPVSHSRPTLSRSRFGGSRTRARTTAAPAEESEESASSSTSAPAASRPSLTRPRSNFNLRTRGRSTTAAPSSESDESESSAEPSSTTARTRRVQAGSAVRPLRPGPRINLSGRGRPGHTSTTTSEAPIEDHVTGDEEAPSSNGAEDGEESKEEAPAAVDNSPLGRLRNKHRGSNNVQVRPKAAASAPVQVRRVNPLIARRRPGQTTEAPASSEAPAETSSTESAPAEEGEDNNTEEPAASSSTTSEEPRGLNKLLAGRRRLAARPGAHH